MSATCYYEKINDLLARIHSSQGEAIVIERVLPADPPGKSVVARR